MPSDALPTLVRAVHRDALLGLRRLGLHVERIGAPDGIEVDAVLDERSGVGQVVWQATTEHVGEFQGVPPTGRTITVTGATHVSGFDPGEDPNRSSARFTRFVDWAVVLAQLGVTFNTKVMVAPRRDA